MIQDVVICRECGSMQAADVPVKLCACGSDHARDERIRLQASQLCPRCRRLHAIDLRPTKYPDRQCPECSAELDAYYAECEAWEQERELLQEQADRLGLYVGITRDGFIGLVDPPAADNVAAPSSFEIPG